MRKSFLPVVVAACFCLTTAAFARDDSAAVSAQMKQAKAGDAHAQLRLAQMYRDGEHVAKDYANCMQWAHLAADQGLPEALDFIGFQYFHGWGVEQSFDIAVGYYKASSEKCPQGMFNLGLCYFSGQGVELDMEKAVDCWKKAGEKGHGYAAAHVAMAYLDGEGAKIDEAEAMRWAAKAAELDVEAGYALLGELNFRAGKVDAARSAWEKGSGKKARDGNESADLLALIDCRTRKPEPGKFAIVEGPHVHQGWNNCGATSSTMLARFQGAKLNEWDFKRLCPGSPIGTGTDWAELVAASEKIGLKWKLVTYPADDDGFGQGLKLLESEVDAGRPVVIDFTYEGPQFPGGRAGHTLMFTGYIDGGEKVVLRNPAKSSPGLQVMPVSEFKHFWRSAGYSGKAHGVESRPAIMIEQAR